MKTAKTARVNEITVTQDVARLFGGLAAGKKVKARATHPVLCGFVDAFEAELCLPRFRAMPDLMAFREYLERLAAEEDAAVTPEESSDAEAIADTDAPVPAEWSVEPCALPSLPELLKHNADRIAAEELSSRPREELVREFGEMLGVSTPAVDVVPEPVAGPEDNPADDVQPTEEEWDAREDEDTPVEPVEEPKFEPAPEPVTPPATTGDGELTDDERAAMESAMSDSFCDENEFSLTDDTDIDAHDMTHTEPVREKPVAAPVLPEDTFDLTAEEDAALSAVAAVSESPTPSASAVPSSTRSAAD